MEDAGAWRRRDAPAEDIPRTDAAPVVTVVGRLLRGDHGSFERRAREETFRSAVGVNCGRWRDSGFRFPTNGTGRYASVGAEGEISVTRKRSYRAIGVENENEFGDLGADLRAPAGAASADERRTRPTVTCPRHNHALAAFAADPEPDFDDGQNREPFRIPEHALRNASLRHPLEVTEYFGRLVDDFLFRRGGGCGEREKANDEQCADRFHGYT